MSKKKEDGFDLIICDTYGELETGVSKITFKTSKERDEHNKRVQELVKENLTRLKTGEETGNVLLGVNTFSLSTLGMDIFKKENAKRLLVWNREMEGNEKAYHESRSFFMWGVVNRGWIYNLQEGEKFFLGEYLQDGDKYATTLDVVRDMVRRFSNEGGKVLEINLGVSTVVKEAVELEGREYEVLEAAVKC